MMPGARDPHVDGGAWNGLDDRRDHWLYLFGRLKPGISREAAAVSITSVFTGIINDVELPAFPRFMARRAACVEPVAALRMG